MDKNSADHGKQNDKDSSLVAWIIATITPWEDHRDQNYKEKWDEYYRLWRGIHKEEDKTRDHERSKLISPALQQAIEATTAELEEATFGKGTWFDISDDVADEQKEPLQFIRDQLSEDFDLAGVPDSVSEIYLNGCIYGTGIGKIVLEKEVDKIIVQEDVGDQISFKRPTVKTEERLSVILEPVSPREFVIDTSARTIDEAMGMAHILYKPKYSIVKKQKAGIYKDIAIGSANDIPDVFALGEQNVSDTSEITKIIEYHGLVPRSMITDEEEEFVSLFDEEEEEASEFDMVEAIVTIANDAYLLKAVENPTLKKDRAFIAYQHDTVPNRFWGRGVAEKGYNPQKALDAELRARLDSLALTVYPMMAGDITRLPRGMDLQVKPGKYIHTNGDPRSVLMPFSFGNVDPNTYRNAADLERMIQMGTGAMDSAAPMGVSARNNTASGMSMIQSGSIKRSKRTMQNIDRNFLSKLIKKALWRYIQFDNKRYPVYDYKYNVVSTMGIMARELEQQQLIGLLATTPPDCPAYWILLRTIFENSSISNRDEVVQAVAQIQEQIQNPPPPAPEPPDPMVELTAQRDQRTHQREMDRLTIDKQRVDQEGQKLQIQASEVSAQQMIAEAKVVAEMMVNQSSAAKDEATTILTLAKAQSEMVDSKLSQYELLLETLKTQMTESTNSIKGDIQGSAQKPQGNPRLEAEMKSFKSELSTFVANSVGDIYDSVSSQKSDVDGRVEELGEKVERLIGMIGSSPKETSGFEIERDRDGLVTSVNGKPVKRNAEGLIAGVED